MHYLLYRILFSILFVIFSLPIWANTTILISFDGFRWDYLDRKLNPKLDSLIAEGVHSLSLKPSFPTLTFPNHVSIVTGMYSENHGILANIFFDLNTFEKFNIANVSVRESKWYNAEFIWETAKRNGIKTASYFWPGSDMIDDYRRPDYFELYEHKRDYKTRIDGVIKWLKLPDSLRPEFITLYFDETDTKAHQYGTNSYQLDKGLKLLDSLMIYFDSELKNINQKDSVNLIILSDHGMSDLVNDSKILLSDIFDCKRCLINNVGALAMIQAPNDVADSIYFLLNKNEKNFKVYKKDEIPERYHYSNHPFVTNLLLVADVGYIFDNGENKSYQHLAMHGYDNENLDMHGIFIARGPAFKESYKCSTILNIDIYPLLCKLLNIKPRSNVDGKIERIEFILREK